MDSDSPAISEDERRFFIITASRTGSSLLSAILADAGASFGMEAPQHWNPSGGALEHPDLLRAARYYRRAAAIAPARPRFGIARLRWVAYRSLAKRRLREALAGARFVKLENTHDLIRPAFRLGYFPTIIVNYRAFEDQAVSLGMLHTHATWESLRDRFQSIYGNALWLLNTFGGCAVDYAQLHDQADDSWARALAQTTGLALECLLAARDRRLDHRHAAAAARAFDPSLGSLFAALQDLRNRSVPPSPPALRAWLAAKSARTAGRLAAPERAPHPLGPFSPFADKGFPSGENAL